LCSGYITCSIKFFISCGTPGSTINILSSFSNVEIYFVEDTKTDFSIEVHFFDTLIYGSELVYSQMLSNRLERSEDIADFCIIAAGDTVAVIQELHIVLAHSLCEYVENEIFNK
jgi:hypothetical protein